MKINRENLENICKNKQLSPELIIRTYHTIKTDVDDSYYGDKHWILVTEPELCQILEISDEELQQYFINSDLKHSEFKSVKDYSKTFHEYVPSGYDFDGQYSKVLWYTSVIGRFEHFKK
jgi:hypothetical protein